MWERLKALLGDSELDDRVVPGRIVENDVANRAVPAANQLFVGFSNIQHAVPFR